MAKRKRTNPKKIPVTVGDIDRHELIASVSHGNMYFAWLLMIPVLFQQEGISREQILSLWDVVNNYVSDSSFLGARLNNELHAIEEIIGAKAPYPSIPFDRIRTKGDLESVRRKLKKNAIYTAICMILIGLNTAGGFDTATLRRIYTNTDITLAEIEQGINSFENLQRWAQSNGFAISEEQDEMSMETDF